MYELEISGMTAEDVIVTGLGIFEKEVFIPNIWKLWLANECRNMTNDESFPFLNGSSLKSVS